LKEALAKMRTARAQKARGSPKSLCKADLAWEQARSLAKHARGVLDQARLVDRHLKRGEVDAALRRAAIAGVQFGWLGRELRGSVDQQSLKTEYGRAVRAERVDEFSRNNEMMAELDRELIAREEERPQAIKRVAQTFGVQPKTVQNVAARLRPTRPRKR
jgi:hypothetical protein